MYEDFVTYEIALKLKAKGFKEKCVAYYWEKINEHTPSFLVEDNMPEDGLNILDLLSNHNQAEWSLFIDAPTISQVLKWLRKEKKIYVSILPFATFSTIDKVAFYYLIEYNSTGETMEGIEQNTYCAEWKDAALAGIEYVLDNLI